MSTSAGTGTRTAVKLTKLEHATLVLELAGKKLIIDPGSFTRPLTDAGLGLADTVAVVVTHEHADHWTAGQLSAVLGQAPGIPIFAPPGVAQAVAAAGAGISLTVVHEGDEFTVGPFALRFFGEKHAVIHSSIPVVDNVGVLVSGVPSAEPGAEPGNEPGDQPAGGSLYYPGDSFTIPGGVDVDVLAVPVGAPWLKIAEVMDFVLAVKPKRSFATHEMVLSEAGKAMGADRIRWATEQNGGEYVALAPGDSFEL